ncbi:hypothetical protein ACFVVX_27085 [Kitasatospora sp. NPDC058170]|uniref:hypothetical protein n=1 Tax=Kitasatospora sp. NPDC058170 TaxID=3346364 RepID=UPI0036DC2F20
MPLIGVLGQGAVGCAVARRLTDRGFAVRAADRDDRRLVLDAAPDVLVMALTRGDESLLQLGELEKAPGVVLDFTTQSPESAARCAHLAAGLGAAYHAGGLTGGGHELAAGRGVLLLGSPVEPDGPAGRVVSALGRAIGFPSAAEAARAKLLHNWVLLVQQWAAALALGEVGPDGHATLVEVLAAGTAGRAVPDWSVVRDARHPARSTYLGRLAAKDLGEITRGLPALAEAGRPVVELLTDALLGGAEQPYTQALLNILDGAGNGPKEAP